MNFVSRPSIGLSMLNVILGIIEDINVINDKYDTIEVVDAEQSYA